MTVLYGLFGPDTTRLWRVLIACNLIASYEYGNLHAMDTKDDRAEARRTTISLRVSSDLYERFKVAAEEDHRSIAGEVRYLIERRVDEMEATA